MSSILSGLTQLERDARQEQRLLAELAHNTLRYRHVLEYKISKYDGDLGNPLCPYRSRRRKSVEH